MIEMKIEECLKAIGGELVSGAGAKVFRGVSIDSRTLKKDELFVCIRGDRLDGHDFIEAVSYTHLTLPTKRIV